MWLSNSIAHVVEEYNENICDLKKHLCDAVLKVFDERELNVLLMNREDIERPEPIASGLVCAVVYPAVDAYGFSNLPR